MYSYLGYLEKTKTYIDSSLVILSFDKYPNYLYNSLGIIQSKTKSYDAAEKTFQTIIQITKKNNMPGLLAQSYANYANLKRRKGAYSEALHYIQLSDSLCTEMGIDFGIVINQVNRAEVYYDQKKYNQAASTLKLIENKIKNFNLIEINKGYYELSYRIYDALGNTNVANAYYRTYIKNKEDFTGDLPRSVISEWELSRERERLNYMDSQHKLVVQQQTQKNYFYAFIIAVLLLSLVVVYLILQKRSMKLQEKMKLEQQKMAFELELKSKELLIKSLKDISIQQSKSSIKEDLDSVLKELPSEYSTKFKRINTKMTEILLIRNIDPFIN
jgi:tetratricopeptide (TPR) repeat protein